MKKIFFFIAVVCWLISLVVHILSIAHIDVRDKVPFIWILHIGIFIVWIPAVLYLIRRNRTSPYQQPALFDLGGQVKFLRNIFKETPNWILVIVAMGFIYAMINFIFVMISQQGDATIRDGQFILQTKGRLIRILTEQEYHLLRSEEVRGFSGHWIAFYGIAAAILYPYDKPLKEQPGSVTFKH